MNEVKVCTLISSTASAPNPLVASREGLNSYNQLIKALLLFMIKRSWIATCCKTEEIKRVATINLLHRKRSPSSY